jgi:hypothetical protein
MIFAHKIGNFSKGAGILTVAALLKKDELV